MSEEDERRSLAVVVERLRGQFPDESGDRVFAVVEAVFEELGSAKVRAYLPVLVEKEARNRLQSSGELAT